MQALPLGEFWVDTVNTEGKGQSTTEDAGTALVMQFFNVGVAARCMGSFNNSETEEREGELRLNAARPPIPALEPLHAAPN